MSNYTEALEKQNEELKERLAAAEEKLAKPKCIVSGLVVTQLNRSFHGDIFKTEITLLGTEDTDFEGDIKELIGNRVNISIKE